MTIAQEIKTRIACIAPLGVLTLLVACGGGGGDDGGNGSGSNKTAAALKTYEIWQCTVYRKTDGLTGISFWGSCESGSFEPRPGEPIFNSLEDCQAAISVLKDTVSSVYDNSDEDKARRWALKLFCEEPDTAAPSVVSKTPVNDSTGFPIVGTSVRAEFSENMDGASIDATSFTLEDSAGTPVMGTVVYYRTSRTASFSIDEPLDYLTSYTARLTTGITDNSGNSLAKEVSWSFTTEDDTPDVVDGTAPARVSELPAANSICGPQDGTITARFDELIAPSGTFTLKDSSGVLVDGTVTFGANTATFTSSLPLDYDEIYTAYLGGDIADEAGNTITPSDWSFRTESNPEGTWTPIATPANVARRAGHTAVWTGDEMIVWGGYNRDNPAFPNFQYLTENGRYDPVLDTWTSVSTVGAPQKREQHTATWTGTEMIVWGGILGQCSGIGCLYSTNTGGRYDPATDSWQPMSTVGAPSPRRFHTAIWTGAELIVWGGVDNDYTDPLGDGARYDPATDTWSPLSSINAPAARGNHKAIFDNGQMIVWGGVSSGALDTVDGMIYDPTSDVWLALPSQDAPVRNSGIAPASVVSTGTGMFVWLPEHKWDYDPVSDEWYDSYASQTRRYNYQDQQWSAVVAACNPRATPTAVWLNGRVLSWNSDYTMGQSYDEALDAWIPIMPHPDGGQPGASVVVTGDSAIVWGGSDSNIGYRLSPSW